MRCDNYHPKGDCVKTPEEYPLCANYNANHTVDYRGCSINKTALLRQKEQNDLRSRVFQKSQPRLRTQQAAPAVPKLPPQQVTQASRSDGKSISLMEPPTT